jgi:hypothetical protein
LRELVNPLLGTTLHPGIDCIIEVGDLQLQTPSTFSRPDARCIARAG